MTVATEISANEYTGNGVTTEFDYKFRVFKESHLNVTVSDSAGDDVITLRLGTDYSVTGVKKSSGGKVILTRPLANGSKIAIVRELPITQETSFRNQSKFFAETHEDAFDMNIMISQQQQREIDRSVKVPLSAGYSPDELIYEIKKDALRSESARDASVIASNESKVIAEKFGDIDNAISIANTAAESAKGSEIKSVNAAERAESAASDSKLFDTVEYGLAESIDGEYFRIWQLSSTGISFIYYKNENGVAIEITDYPSASSVKKIVLGFELAGMLNDISDESNIIPIIIDNENNILFGYDKNHDRLIGSVASGDLELFNQLVLGQKMAGMFNFDNEEPKVFPIAIDDDKNIIIGYDSEADEVVAAGIATVSKQAKIGMLNYYGKGQVTPLIIDIENNIILGFDNNEGKLVGAIDSSTSQSTIIDSNSLRPELVPANTEVKQIIVYGQSLTIGASTKEVISSTQSYKNVTFQFGPRTPSQLADEKIFFPIKPLVESYQYTSGNDCAETICSGAANFACNLYLRNGGDIDDRVFLATAAGRGDTKIIDLQKGVAWYNQMFLPHISKSVEYNSNTSVTAIPWLQGEADCTAETSFEDYLYLINKLQADIEQDAKNITGQTSPVHLITYQLSYKTLLTKGVSSAQLHAVRNNDKIWLSTPTYNIQCNTDLVHLTATGYKHLGAYVGRTIDSLLKGKKPRFLNPLSATSRDSEITIKFDVPVKPLVFDTEFVTSLTDYGVAVVDSAGAKKSLSSIQVSESGDSIIMTCAEIPQQNWQVRLGYDYRVHNGRDMAGTNIRDSDDEYIIIKNEKFNLWNVCPHAILNINLLGE